jgi:hypothetical protein
MKTYHLFLIILTLGIFTSCEQSPQLILKNPSDEAIKGKIVSIPASSFTKGKAGQYPLLIHEGDTIPTQIIDHHEDGTWGQIISLLDFDAEEQKVLNYHWIPADDYPSFKQRTNVYLGYSEERNNVFTAVDKHIQPADHKPQDYPLRYQSEGPIWESDLIAFRSYFDARNGKDIFGKTRPDIRAEKIGYNEDYHQPQDWGMDVLKVGTSLGAGALAILKNDSIIRLGVTETSSFEILENGPLMTSFKLTYTGWDVKEQDYGLEETIRIYAGKRWYESEVKLTGAASTDTLVTGIVTLKAPSIKTMQAAGYSILYTHGKQGENNDYLGMALFTKDSHFAGFDEAPTEGPGVTNTQLIYLKPVENKYHFYFCSGWEGEQKSFTKQDFFEKEILQEVKILTLKIN